MGNEEQAQGLGDREHLAQGVVICCSTITRCAALRIRELLLVSSQQFSSELDSTVWEAPGHPNKQAYALHPTLHSQAPAMLVWAGPAPPASGDAEMAALLFASWGNKLLRTCLNFSAFYRGQIMRSGRKVSLSSRSGNKGHKGQRGENNQLLFRH